MVEAVGASIEELQQRRDTAAKAVIDWMNSEGAQMRIRYNYQAPGWPEYEAAESALQAALALQNQAPATK